MDRVFANGLGDLGSIPGHVIPKTSATPWCSCYWKGSLLVAFDYSCQLYLLLLDTQSWREVSFPHEEQNKIILNPSPNPVSMYLPDCSTSMWHKVNFKWNTAGLNLEFFLLDWLPSWGKRIQSALLSIHSWEEKRWIHTFSKGISMKWR